MHLLHSVVLVLTLFSCVHAASHVEAAKEDFVNAWKHGEPEELHPFIGSHTQIDSLQHVLYCGNRDLSYTPKCIRYRYESSVLIEAFIVDGRALQMKKDTGQGLVSDGVIVPGSYCIGSSCQLTADLKGVSDWCLLFLNIDPGLLTADVTFEYQVCADHDHKNDLILILSVTCAALIIVAFFACLACCWMIKRRKRDSEADQAKDDLMSSMNMPLIPPPPARPSPDIFFSVPPPPPVPMVSHAPFRHEPSFQVQPPPLPLSHVPPPPMSSSQPSTSTSQEIHVQFPNSEKKSRSKSMKKIRFPI